MLCSSILWLFFACLYRAICEHMTVLKCCRIGFAFGEFQAFLFSSVVGTLGTYPQCHKDLPVMFLQLLEAVYSVLYAPLS